MTEVEKRAPRPIRAKDDPSGWMREYLLEGLSHGAEHKELADMLGVTKTSVTNFANRNRALIAARRSEDAARFSTLWIARKEHRIAEYQADVELINRLLVEGEGLRTEITFAEDGTPVEVKITDSGTAALLGRKSRIMHQVAEELGQLPARQQINIIQPTQVSYQVSGVDLDHLR